MTHPVSVVFGKEFTDGRRDKRAILSAFLFPFFAPMIVYFMMTAIIELRTDTDTLTIPVVGAEFAPSLIQWLEEQDVRVQKFEGDPEASVRNKEHELILIIPEDYQERLAELRTIPIEIVNDGSRNDARTKVSRAHSLVRRYNQEISALRLISRGISPSIARVVSGRNVDVASKQQRTAQALNFIPLYILLSAFVSGMGIAVDSTAGERERKTLEPLILNPVERHHIVMGKWFAASLFSALGMITTLLLCIYAMTLVPLDQIGLAFHLNAFQITMLVLAVLPLPFLATSMQLLLGIFAKSFKDAQSYIGLLTLLPAVPSMYLMFNPVVAQDWMFAIPMLGQHLLMVDVMGAKEVPLIAYVYSAVSCLVLGMALVLITARLFQRESMISN
jgi:sodium transport system permease protein